MKYVANPVIVDAFKIATMENCLDGLTLQLEDGSKKFATKEMTARYTPKEGDYWVVQSDGYEYLNPADVFERKYSPVKE